MHHVGSATAAFVVHSASLFIFIQSSSSCSSGHSRLTSWNRWEHDPAWAVTSKLLISKHQQVQLLEAAAALVNMNQNALSGDVPESEASSVSPDASSELHGGLSSAETTPPPVDDRDNDFAMSDNMQDTKRFSVSEASTGYAHSYQSGPSSSFMATNSPAFSHFRHSSIDARPSTTSETKLPDDIEAELAAAIRLCNFGTPRTGPLAVSTDELPPVPPLPAHFLDQTSAIDESGSSATALTEQNVLPPLSFNPSLSYKVSDERSEAKIGHSERESRHRRNDDVDFGTRQAHADDDDDGVFGRMEE